MLPAVPGSQVDKEAERLFSLLDRDHSGDVSWAEFKEVVDLQPLVVAFFQLDCDATGSLGDGSGSEGSESDMEDAARLHGAHMHAADHGEDV